MRRGSVEGLAGAIARALLESDAFAGSGPISASTGGARIAARRGPPGRDPAQASGRGAGLAALVASRIVARLGGTNDDGELPLDTIEI